MTHISRRTADPTRRMRFAGLGLMMALLSAGCSERDQVPETHRIDGTIEQIDLTTGEVTVSFYSEKHKREASVTGRATPETEILINGQVATLADLRIGERLTVIGYIKSQSTGKQVIARSVLVQRSAPIRRTEPTAADQVGNGHAAGDSSTRPGDDTNGDGAASHNAATGNGATGDGGTATPPEGA